MGPIGEFGWEAVIRSSRPNYAQRARSGRSKSKCSLRSPSRGLSIEFLAAIEFEDMCVTLFIDANQYLSLYGMVAGKKLLDSLEKQKAYIFVSAQIVDEVLRNKLRCAAPLYLIIFSESAIKRRLNSGEVLRKRSTHE